MVSKVSWFQGSTDSPKDVLKKCRARRRREVDVGETCREGLALIQESCLPPGRPEFGTRQ